MDLNLIILIVGFFILPLYSAKIMEWRIKKYAKQFQIEQFTQAIIKIMEGLDNAGLIEGEHGIETIPQLGFKEGEKNE